MKKLSVQLASLILFFATFAPSMAMEQKPIYEILARNKADEYRESQEGNRQWFPKDYDFRGAAEEVYSDLVTEYKRDEDVLNSGKKFGMAWFGPLDYSMTLEKMKQNTKEVFSEMKKNGLIISKAEFGRIKDKYFDHPFTDLTRIWGGMYLRHRIDAAGLSQEYGVPNYIIVVDDPHKISVNIVFGPAGPSIASLSNGEIYFENIKGKGIAHEEKKRGGIGIREYVDYADPGNIIQQEGTGKKYIVDTEAKSFEVRPSANRVESEAALGRLDRLLEYAGDRFRYLNPGVDVRTTYEFDLQ